jgi:hypothetical protein
VFLMQAPSCAGGTSSGRCRRGLAAVALTRPRLSGADRTAAHQRWADRRRAGPIALGDGDGQAIQTQAHSARSSRSRHRIPGGRAVVAVCELSDAAVRRGVRGDAGVADCRRLDRPDVDAVIIAAPDMARRMAIEALGAGRLPRSPSR